jgi:hypothetical protein
MPEFHARYEQVTKMDDDYKKMIAGVEKQKTEGLNRTLAAVDDLKDTHIHSWWAQASTGATILGAISQILAGGLQGLTGQGGPTPMDRITDNDLAVQKANYARKSDVASQSRSLYGDLMQNLKDEVMAETAFRNIADNSFIERMKAMAGSMGDKKAQAEMEKAIAERRQAMADRVSSVREYLGKSALETAHSAANMDSVWGSVMTTQRGQDMDNNAKMQAGKGLVGINQIPGFEYVVKAMPERAGKLMDAWDATSNIKHSVKDLQKLLAGDEVDRDGKPVMDKDGNPAKIRDGIKRGNNYAAQLDQHIGDLTASLKDLLKLGQISGGDQGLVDRIVGTKGGWATIVADKTWGFSSYEDVAARLEGVAQRSQDRMRRSIEHLSVGGQQLKINEEQ